MLEQPLVLENDYGIRPAGPQDACFYCRSKVGEPHGQECVAVRKVVDIRFIVRAGDERIVFEMKDEVPRHWSMRQALFRYNDGGFCLDNLIEELTEGPDGPNKEQAKIVAKALTMAGICACSVGGVELDEDWDEPEVVLPQHDTTPDVIEQVDW